MSICVPSMHPKACGIPNFNLNSEAVFPISFSENKSRPRIALIASQTLAIAFDTVIDGFEMYLRPSRVSRYLLDNKL